MGSLRDDYESEAVSSDVEMLGNLPQAGAQEERSRGCRGRACVWKEASSNCTRGPHGQEAPELLDDAVCL